MAAGARPPTRLPLQHILTAHEVAVMCAAAHRPNFVLQVRTACACLPTRVASGTKSPRHHAHKCAHTTTTTYTNTDDPHTAANARTLP